MKANVDLGPVPTQESSAQFGNPGYERRATDEMRRFISLIRMTCGQEPPGARLSIRWLVHEFGRYGSVVCTYDVDSLEAKRYARHVEINKPSEWSKALVAHEGHQTI